MTLLGHYQRKLRMQIFRIFSKKKKRSQSRSEYYKNSIISDTLQVPIMNKRLVASFIDILVYFII